MIIIIIILLLSLLWLLLLITIIIIIIIVLKGAVSDFLQSPHCSVNCLQHFHSQGQSAIKHISRATCRVPHGRKGHLSFQVWQSLGRIYFSCILLAEPLTTEGGEETGAPGKEPNDELQCKLWTNRGKVSWFRKWGHKKYPGYYCIEQSALVEAALFFHSISSKWNGPCNWFAQIWNINQLRACLKSFLLTGARK